MENKNLKRETDSVQQDRKVAGSLPSYRPWDWIGGYVLCSLVVYLMFAYAQSSYN